MASQAFPQALVSVPRTVFPCSSKKIGFSSVFSFRSSASCYNRIITSRVSSSGFDLKFDPLVARRKNPLFVVRAEPNSEGEGGVEAIENAAVDPEVPATEPELESEAEGEAETVAVEEAEPKPPRKPRVKLGDIMGILHKRAIEASEKERPVPDIRTGDIVEIKLEVPENRRRLSNYKGIVISKQNAGIHTTIRIRRIVAGIGVEIVFPVYSPNIKELKVVNHRKHTIVLRSVEPTATFGIDHDTKSGYETAPVSRSTTLRRSASNRNGAGDALATRVCRREEAAQDRTKSGAHKALRGLRFISNQKGFDGWSQIENNFEKFAKDGSLQRSDFGQCVEGGQERRWKNWRRSEGELLFHPFSPLFSNRNPRYSRHIVRIGFWTGQPLSFSPLVQQTHLLPQNFFGIDAVL
ncbi:hypothetical protein NE237_012510 [Protea cynaroides]|uniref:NADPH oxidase Respiratory burst domain-containing protein n=1 Tax=Protea cynaroides TaxID=273540 RepID=A0A9Q0JY30_9MAGN|nr:hypothetical protein NE237_012510 [Protea cynaroides]